MTGRVTRKDVAKEATVSETIVSYVLNGGRYVDRAKRERVVNAVKRLGYRPSPVARALKGKESRHFLFIVDDLMTEYFGSIMGEMEKCSEEGTLISLASDNGGSSLIPRILGWVFDGIIIGSATMANEDIQRIINTGIPTVVLSINDYPTFEGAYGLIYTGLKEGAEEAMTYLKNKGCSKIAYADGSSPHGLNREDFRYKGYSESLSGSNEVIISGVSDRNELRLTTIEVLKKEGFDAVLCRTDAVAAEILFALNESGVGVPDEVKLIGFNDSAFTEYTKPSLSSVRINKSEIARVAMGMMKSMRNGSATGVVKENLSTELIIRGSS